MEFDLNPSKALAYIAGFSISIPILIGGFAFIKFPKSLKLLYAYLIFAGLIELIFMFLAQKNVNNMLLITIFIVIEFGLLSLAYYYTFNSAVLKKGIILLVLSFTAFTIINAFYIQGLYTFNSNSRSLECILLMVLGFMYFYKVFTELNIPRIEKHPMFWVNSGILIYFSGNLFLFILFNNILVQRDEYFYDKWVIHSLLNIFINLFFAVGLWLSPRKQISLSY